MIDPSVRPATAADVADVAWLEDLARTSLVGQRGGDRWLATHPPHGGRPAGDGRVWVAAIDGVVLGYLVMTVGGEVARVTDVYVHPDAREVGCGDGLLAAALDAARQAGAGVLEAEALPGDRETKNLYERAGITARLITVSTPL